MAHGGIARFGRSGVFLAFCVLLARCGGGDCQQCTTFTNCPSIVKQCPGYTATVQQCSGASGKMCCATTAAQISCTTLTQTRATYSVIDGLVMLTPADTSRCLRFWIDAKDNGWITDAMSGAEQQAAIRVKMTEVNPGATER